MLKLLAKFLLVLGFFLVSVSFTYAQNNPVNIYFFWGEGCPHCATEKPFLDNVKEKYPQVEVHEFEVWSNSRNRKYLTEVGNRLRADVSGVPFTVIGDEAYTGFNRSLTGPQIEERVKFCSENVCPDSVAEVIGLNTNSQQIPLESGEKQTAPTTKLQPNKANVIPNKLDIPIFGEIQTKNLSLPVFTIVLGGLDGFNPCAMWTLLFLISLLLGMKDKKRRWILGTAFILASAFVYFLFMAAWLNLILFIGVIVWVRTVIGLIALGGGAYNLKEFFTNKDSGCKVTGEEKRRAVFEKLKEITHERKFVIALGGIVLLAFAVNLVELICSAGLPVVFTQVLALSDLSTWEYYLYMLLYILIFLLDDLIVFFTAMITVEMTGISTKYGRISHLIGGALMMIIGLLLMFKPEWLMFG